ncbi:MAG TPA: acetylxylan esterase [Arachidicoccus sp.]|nr:acetylxylan esterase [Arachidicoccus sp.]
MRSTLTARFCQLLLLIFVFVSLPGGFCATAANSNSDNHPNTSIQLFGIGNTRMSDQPLTSPFRGWMQMLPMFFSPDIHFKNLSEDSLSLEAFIQTEAGKTVYEQLNPGDYVLISFKEIYDAALAPLSAGTLHDLKTIIGKVDEKKAHTIIICAPSGKKDLQEAIHGTGSVTLLGVQVMAEKKLIAPSDQLDFQRVRPLLKVYQAIQYAANVAKIIKTNFSALSAVPSESLDDNQMQLTQSALQAPKTDMIAGQLRTEAAKEANQRHILTPGPAQIETASALRSKLMRLCGAKRYPTLPVDIKETGRIKADGYQIHKIYFQTRPGVYATADLYVPERKGPLHKYPAVINMHGHWPDGKAGEMVQSCAIQLALNGFVCLNIDAWGAGERTTQQNVAEYHGSNLGAFLMNIGESLLGMQLTDNMRGVDLLCSLPYVDSANIGATGASGGGNQTMWLAALDPRIKACMPVVSVGTFQSYIMGSNCVCELMPEGLTVATEADVLSLIAPRYIKICSGLLDANPTFSPYQMLKSFRGAGPYFKALSASDHLQYQLFNTPHGYWPEMRSAMLGWFSTTLKTDIKAAFLPEKTFQLLPPRELLVFGDQQRSPLIATTVSYCEAQGGKLFHKLLSGSQMDAASKRAELRKLLMIPALKYSPDGRYYPTGSLQGQAPGWQNWALQSDSNHIIPFSVFPSNNPGAPILLICPPDSAGGSQDYVNNYIQQHFKTAMDRLQNQGYTIVVAALWGLGKAASTEGRKTNGALPLFHTLARADLWLGHTVMGEWVSQLHLLTNFLKGRYATETVAVMAGKEVAIAALCTGALYTDFKQLYLDQLPVSYVVDKRAGMDYFNMGIHIPAVLKWGDISLMAALNHQAQISIHSPVTITGSKLSDKEIKKFREIFQQINKTRSQNNHITFDLL